MEKTRKYRIDWQQHVALAALLTEAPPWQLDGLTAFVEKLQFPAAIAGFPEWLQAFRRLDYANRLHLGYALRQRGGTGARMLAEQHGNKTEFREYIKVCQALDIQLPEGF